MSKTPRANPYKYVNPYYRNENQLSRWYHKEKASHYAESTLSFPDLKRTKKLERMPEPLVQTKILSFLKFFKNNEITPNYTKPPYDKLTIIGFVFTSTGNGIYIFDNQIRQQPTKDKSRVDQIRTRISFVPFTYPVERPLPPVLKRSPFCQFA